MSIYACICLHALACPLHNNAYVLYCLHIPAYRMHMLAYPCMRNAYAVLVHMIKIIYLPKCTFLNINLGFRV